MSSDGSVLLELEDVHTFYGTIEAIKGISMTVNEGEIVTLIGANGAGKSTTLARSGVQQARARQDPVQGRGPRRPPTARHREAGDQPVARGPPPLLTDERAREPRDGGVPTQRQGRDRARISTASTSSSPGSRSGARRRPARSRAASSRCCAIGRALMAQPKLLMLDEPSLGLAPILVERIFDIVREINKPGTSILLVEQNALIALAWPTAATCSRRAMSRCTTRPPPCAGTSRCARRISAKPELRPRSGRPPAARP